MSFIAMLIVLCSYLGPESPILEAKFNFIVDTGGRLLLSVFLSSMIHACCMYRQAVMLQIREHPVHVWWSG